MTKYYLNGEEVSRPKKVKINGVTFYSPSDALIIQAGYEIREVEDEQPTPTPTPNPQPSTKTYEEYVEQYIREHGYPTYGAEFAVLNNYAVNPETAAQEYVTYQGVRQDAKTWAHNQLSEQSQD